MRNLVRLLAAFFIVATFSAVVSVETSAATNVREACHYDSTQKVNPDIQTMNCLLTETALNYNVPPEIVKAIAEGESGDWQHFDGNGNVIVTGDNGIGLMQVTNQSKYDEQLLKDDISYNIQAGVELLDQMFKRTDLPTINSKDRNVLEHWYFAIMAYNGTKPVNSPVVQATGQQNMDAYQEKIIRKIEEYGLVKLTDLPFKTSDFRYDSNSTTNIEFVTKNFNFNLPFTKSKHSFVTGQKVMTTDATNLRPQPTTGGTYTKLAKGEIITITGPFQYDQDVMKKNHFVWYPVKRSNGTTGYVASSYLKERFADIPVGHYAENHIEYLVDRGIINGIGDNKFGIEQGLKRWQAVLILTRANNVSLENHPDPGFKDVPKNYLYYKEISAAVDTGLFTGFPTGEFKPENTLTRAEMAELLQRLYKFPKASGNTPFTDLKDDWYKESVARLYAAGITDGINKTQFGPSSTVTREQFAVFMVRSMDESYRLK